MPASIREMLDSMPGKKVRVASTSTSTSRFPGPAFIALGQSQGLISIHEAHHQGPMRQLELAEHRS